MQYPLISEYVRAIQDANDNLGELAHLVPVLDNHGEPYRSSGAFAVVFKMKDEQTGKCFALKCFTEEQEGRAEAYHRIADELECVDSSYLTSVKYLEKEIFVDSSCEEEEFPVLLMDWVDGETMETYIASNYRDEYAMAMLCYRFCKMAAWLRSQPFAHGDIKPDNIMVRPDGSLTLVDYDGMFVPAMNGQKSPTIGTKDFSHPSRTVDDFDETIDDFALASIALSLKAISLKPSLFDEYGASDRLLFSADDYLNMSKSKVVTALQELMNDEEIKTLFSLFILASAKKNLALSSFRLFIGKKPENKIEVLSTKVSKEDWADSVMDEYGVEYSRDGKRLLIAPPGLEGTYKIKINTKIICDWAFCKYSSFQSCGSLRSIVIPNSVTSIGNGAFYDCGSLVSLVIPDSVTSIGNYAFGGCNSLESIVIPDSVMSIGDGAFSGCVSLESIVIPKSVRIMAGNPFDGWKGDLSVLSTNFIYDKDVLFDVKKEKIIAFRRDDTSYVIPNSVTSIGDRAFSGCFSLTRIVIPDSVTSIGDRAFSWCSSLRSIVIPNSVTNIGDGAFIRCDSLESLVIPDSVTSIGDSAFGCCDSLESIVIPNSVTSIGNDAFEGSGSLESLVIPNSVTSIGDGAFSGCRSLASIDIPDSVTSIGDSAFRGCRSLSNLVIPNSVTSIGDGAFSGCISLKSLVIPNSVRIMTGNPFDGWKGDLSVLSTNFIYDKDVLFDVKKEKIIAFRRDDTSYVIPDSVMSIGDGAFSDCGSLKRIVIPKSVTSIGDSAFCGCDSLESLVIPNSVTSIGDDAFNGCSSLRSIAIPDSVRSIGNFAFRDCSSLASLVIPDSVTGIGLAAFEACDSLRSIAIPDSVRSIGDFAFRDCSSLASILIPDGVTDIGHAAFENCGSLRSIAIPDSVRIIGDLAFKNCYSLTNIVIPDSVTSIGNSAFKGCYLLNDIITEGGARVIIIESKRKKRENILKQYPGAIIADVTSHATDDLIKLSPFYPHGGIPVPFSEGVTATCVEAVWQGLKVFETADVDINMFRNDTMKNIKRTVRQFGRPLGHRKGVNGTELLGYIEARKQIYIPTYRWMLEHKVPDIIKRLKEASKTKTIVLLDYNTNCDVDDPTKPLSHAFLIKAYVEGLYPYEEKKEETEQIEIPF